MPSVDHYAVLEISKSARDVEIKKAYHRLAIKYHPHKNPEDPVVATEKFLRVSEAHHVLRDPEKRRKYENELAFQTFLSTIFRPAAYLNSHLFHITGPLTLSDFIINVLALGVVTYSLLSLISEDVEDYGWFLYTIYSFKIWNWI